MCMNFVPLCCEQPLVTLVFTQVIVELAMHDGDRRVKLAAVKALQAFCIANPEGQLSLLSDLSAHTPSQSIGECIYALPL